MSDKLSVLLLKRIAGIGKEGEIVTVSHAQAKNYLIPKGLASLATPDVLKKHEDKKKKETENARLLDEKRHEIAKKLHMQVIEFALQGVGTKVFGGIDEHMILGAISRKFGIDLEKKHIKLPEEKHIKKSGKHDIKIILSGDTYIRMTVEVSVTEK
jgi:large subunit ribosomal protein L9